MTEYFIRNHKYNDYYYYTNNSNAIADFWKLDAVITILARYGLTADDLHTHSIRKAAGSFAAASEHVSLITLCLRAAWTIAAVMKKYLHFEKGGDQMLGRVLTTMDSTVRCDCVCDLCASSHHPLFSSHL
jgi:hypothetical protein